MDINRKTLHFSDLDKNVKMAFLSTTIIGLLIHIYKFTNTLPNHDSVYNYYSDQNVVGSGRWLLSIACGFSSYFDLPWVNGLLSIIFIAATATVIVKLFDIKNYVLIIITSGLLVSFPAITETFFFGFTADGYMLAMFLAALAVYFSRIADKKIIHTVLSACFVCMTCAIYQAYVSFALVLAVCYFMWELLKNKNTIKEYLHWIYKQIVIYIAGLGTYFIIWKLCLAIQGVQVNHIHGIDKVGQVSFELLIQGVKNTIRSLMLFFLEWNVLEHGWTLYGILNVIFLIFLIMAIVTAIISSKLYMRRIQFVLFLVCILALPFFCCIWNFVSEEVAYRPMLLQSVCVLYIFAAILFGSEYTTRLFKPVRLLLIVIIFNYGIQANICYYLMNKEYETSYATGVEMMSRIHLMDEEIRNIAFVGNIAGDVSWDITEYKDKAHLLSSCLEQTLVFDHEHAIRFLNNTFDSEYMSVTTEELKKLEKSETVKSMGKWPAKDSMKMFGDTLVIKLSDPQDYEAEN